VTQGSPLAGTLFIIFENDFFYLPLKSFSSGFADDINSVSTHPSGATALKYVSADLPLIYQWYHENKLAINTRKTKFMVFTRDNEQIAIPPELNSITQVSEMKILGLTFNCNLSYAEHIRMVLNKLAVTNAMLLKLRLNGYPKSSLLSVYQALFVPHLLYCASVWGFSTRNLLRPIQTQQNKALRLIYGLGPRDSTQAVMTANSLPNVDQCIKMSMAKFIYSQVISRGSHPLLRALLHRSGSHLGDSMPTRSQAARDLYVPAFYTERRRRTAYIKGVVQYNKLPWSVRCPSSLASFRSRLKKFTLAQSGSIT
jgi:hypothetical protein